MKKPANSSGGFVPVLRNIGRLFVHTCRRPKGGDKTIQAPEYVLKVTNPDGQIFIPK
jgi:hypothetical protein